MLHRGVVTLAYGWYKLIHDTAYREKRPSWTPPHPYNESLELYKAGTLRTTYPQESPEVITLASVATRYLTTMSICARVVVTLHWSPVSPDLADAFCTCRFKRAPLVFVEDLRPVCIITISSVLLTARGHVY